MCVFFFFQAEDGIRDHCVTGVQTCALPISPGGERDAADNCVEQRGLAAAVRPDDRQAVRPAELEVDRPEPKGAALDDGFLEPGDDIAGTTLWCEAEPELPGLVRLVDLRQPVDAPADRALHILRLLLLAPLAVAAFLPALHLPHLLLESRLLALIRVVRLVLAPQRVRARMLVLAPAAGELGGAVRPLVKLDDSIHRPVEEVAVVRDDHERSRQ